MYVFLYVFEKYNGYFLIRHEITHFKRTRVLLSYKRIKRNKITSSEMGGACSAYGGEEKCVQGFGGET
jgi:hypothetical protein